ncbi:MAG TPA: 4-hydroxy-tetrahydrodipicolinate synthase, partial [Gammaproteobacteria bacterium]
LIQSGIRLPLTWLSERYHPAVRDALKQAGLI